MDPLLLTTCPLTDPNREHSVDASIALFVDDLIRIALLPHPCDPLRENPRRGLEFAWLPAASHVRSILNTQDQALGTRLASLGTIQNPTKLDFPANICGKGIAWDPVDTCTSGNQA